jgi:exopolyphosphatase/guanosine-5'-triphosphate,3'-diphosphate pyrophosphatase
MELSMSKIDKQHGVSYFAALDIGSNSFHFVLARQIYQQVQIVHSEKYKVKLATGLDKNRKLNDDAIARGIATLTSLSSSTSHLNSDNFKVVATFALREAKNANEFLSKARQVFPFDIDIISGHEEARLIYCGVNYHNSSSEQRLVIDIGGGSTECIIGKQENIHLLASLPMGCVSYTEAFFNKDEITESQFSQAISAAKTVIGKIVKRYKKVSWQHVIGTSGTIKAIHQVVNHQQNINQPISLKCLQTLQTKLIHCQRLESINIAGLKPGRNNVICAGVAVLTALMESLEINTIDYCKYALREGVLSEQLKNVEYNDTRQRTINSLVKRFNIDTEQLTLVKIAAEHLFSHLKTAWKFNKAIYQELLIAAVYLHEIGYDINTSGYHKHGEYILSHADLAGFSQEQQQALAWLVGMQRKNITSRPKETSQALQPHLLIKLLAILRLSIILNQQRLLTMEHLPIIHIKQKKVYLQFETQWLKDRPLINKALSIELHLLAEYDIDMKVSYLS